MTELLANRIYETLHRGVSLREFHNWFVMYTLGGPIDPADAVAAEDIESAMAEFTGDYMSEHVFRNVLRHHLDHDAITASFGQQPPSARRYWSSSASQTTQFEPLRVSG